jgi:hypothetical protein
MADPKDILRRSKRELSGAVMALQAMRDARDFEAYAVAWQTFLDKLEKVWVKAERECQHVRNRFEPWQAAFKELRKTDPVLCYLHQARHADQHSIQPTACEAIFGFTMEIPPGGTVDVDLDEEKGKVRVRGAFQIKAVRGPHFMLVPITNPAVLHLSEKLWSNPAGFAAGNPTDLSRGRILPRCAILLAPHIGIEVGRKYWTRKARVLPIERDGD